MLRLMLSLKRRTPCESIIMNRLGWCIQVTEVEGARVQMISRATGARGAEWLGAASAPAIKLTQAGCGRLRVQSRYRLHMHLSTTV